MKQLRRVTYVGHLGHGRVVGPVRELGLVVVDVLDLHHELRLGLQRLVRQAVAGLRPQEVLGLHLAVQPLDGVDVPRAVVDGEGGAGALARQDVLDGAVASVHVGVELLGATCLWMLVLKDNLHFLLF